jgi:hypothetical protein
MFSLANFHSMLALERCNPSVYFTEALSGFAFCRRFSVRVRLFPVFSGGKMTAGFCPPKLLIFFASHLQYSRRCFTVDLPEKGSLSIQPVPICPAKMCEFPTLHRARIFITAARTSILSFANLSDWRMIYYVLCAEQIGPEAPGSARFLQSCTKYRGPEMCAGAPNDMSAQMFGLPEPPCYQPAPMPKTTPLQPARAQTLPPSEGFSADSGLNFADDFMENDASEFVSDKIGNEHGSSNSTPGEEEGDPPSGESSVKGLLEDLESTSSKAAEGALGGGGNHPLDLEWMQGSTLRGDDFEWEGVLDRLPAFDLPGEWAADFPKGAAEETRNPTQLQGGEAMSGRRGMGAVQTEGGSGTEVAHLGGEHTGEAAWLGGGGAEWGDGLEQMFSRRVASESQVDAQEMRTAELGAESGVSGGGNPDSAQRPMFEQLDMDPSRVSRFRLPDAPFLSTKRKAQNGGFAHAPVASATTPPHGIPLSPVELLKQEFTERGAPMEIEQPQASVQHLPTGELSNPARAAGIARQLASEEGRHLARANPLQRTRSDPAQWLQSYNSGKGLLGDAIAPLPPPRAPRLSRLQRQNSLPHFSGGPPEGGRLQRQRSAPEPEVMRNLAQQILLEMQQNEEPVEGGEAEHELNVNHLLFNRHRSLTEIPTPGAWGGDPSEGCQPWLGGPPQRLKADKRAKFQQQREIEARWQEHAQQRASAQTLSGIPPSLAGIARPAGRGGAHRGERRRAPLSESFPAAHQPSSFGQSQVQTAHQAMRNQLAGPSEVPPWLPAESLPPVAPASFSELPPQPAFGKPPSSHQTYERIVIPDLPGGGSPNATLPSMPNQSFVVPVGPHLAQVMRIFQGAQHTGVANQHELPTGPPVKAPAQPANFSTVSPRTQLPDWQMLAFENVPLELEFADSPGADTDWFPS